MSKPELDTTGNSLLLCCYNDIGSFAQQACKCMYSQGYSLTFGRDHGRDTDQEHLNQLIGGRKATVWFCVTFEADYDTKSRICAHLQKFAEILSANDGLLIVDLGNNGGLSDEAVRPWNSLNTVLTYHQIQACNLGVNLKGVPLRRKLHYMISKSCKLPDLSKCECKAAGGGRHIHRLSKCTQNEEYQEAMLQIRQLVLFACDHKRWSFFNSAAVKEMLTAATPIMCERFKRFVHDKLQEMKQTNRDEIRPERGEIEQGSQESVYPTEARMRQKEKEKQHKLLTGEKHKPKSRKKVIQPGNDDCGEDISSLEHYIEAFVYAMNDRGRRRQTAATHESRQNREMSIFLMNDEGELNTSKYFWGSHINDLPDEANSGSTLYENFTQCYDDVLKTPPARHEHDIFELCGGDERTSKVLIRRRAIRRSRTLDMTAGINLLDQEEVRLLFAYLDEHKPICGILSPPCTGLSGFADLNKARNPVGWWKKASVSVRLGYVAGLVAIRQLREGRHFICENPAGSMLHDLQPWREISEDHRIHKTIMHQCAAGLRDYETYRPIKKPT